MSDELFDDEQELIEQQEERASASETVREAHAEGHAARAEAAAATAERAATARRDAPPFWMVLVIAAIALLLGVIIGYLVGTSTAYSLLQETQSEEVQQQYGTAGGTGEQDAASMLPEGHPQVNVDENGKATLAETGEANSADADAADDAAVTE